MNNPIYEPPNPNTAFNTIKDKILAKLNNANTAPVIEIQFFIVDGNFILLF